jgi:peptide-methionine (R)-S-oxide reductase
MSGWKDKDDAYWRSKLTPEQYEVCRRKGTERPFTGEYNSEKRPGTYVCACCGTALFDAAAKYDSGSGWPSFFRVVDAAHIAEETDVTRGMARTEILCAECGGHLGHVFPDGPQPTGLRYCVNSLSLKLEPREE